MSAASLMQVMLAKQLAIVTSHSSYSHLLFSLEDLFITINGTATNTPSSSPRLCSYMCCLPGTCIMVIIAIKAQTSKNTCIGNRCKG